MLSYKDWYKQKDKLFKFLMLFTCVLMLSPLGSNKFLVISGKYVPEIAILFGALLAVSNYKLSRIFVFNLFSTVKPLMLMAMTLTLFYLGSLNGYDVLDSYSLARSFIFVFVGIYLVNFLMKYTSTTNTKYFILTLVILSLIFSIIYFVFISTSVKSAYSVPLILLLAYFASLSSNLKNVVISISIIFFIAITSSFRLYWLYSAAIFFGLMLPLFKNSLTISSGVFMVKKQSFFLLLVLVIGFPLILFLSWELIYEWLAADESRYHQTIYKTQQLYGSIFLGESTGSSATTRTGQFLYLVNNWDNYVFPSGFYDSKGFYGSGGDLSSPIRDSIYFYLSVVFGLYISFFIILYVLYKFLVAIYKSTQARLMRLIIFIILLILFCISGSTLTVISQAFFLGVLYSLQTNKHSQQEAL